MSKVEKLDIEQIESSEENTQPLLRENFDVIKGVKVKLEVRIGAAELTVDELLNLGRSSVVQLNSSIFTPVDLLLDGNIIAKGHLVAVEDNFGIQITDLNPQPR